MSKPPQSIGDTAKPLPKRFYKTVTVGDGAGAFTILLDGRTAKTPLKRPLAVASRELAQDIAAEWQAQRAVIDPATMPLTRLITTAIDAVTGKEADVAAEITMYAVSDLLCYRADGPEALVVRQAKAWNPVLDWAKSSLGASFVATQGLMHVAQPAITSTKIAAVLDGEPALRLAALHVLTTLTGSALLALAVARGRLTLDDAWAAAHIDEDWQIERWGSDAEAEKRRANRLIDARAAARVLSITS